MDIIIAIKGSVRSPFFLCLLIAYCCMACESKKTELAWRQQFFLVGTQSSPRMVDLDQDGVLDVVIGMGRGETTETPQGIVALDGKTGSIIWEQSASSSVVGSAIFHDISGDGVKDVFIGGRNQVFKAINGKTGETLWEYSYSYETDPILQFARFNFYSGTWVPDHNGDGSPEILTVNGGNWDALPNDESERYPGVVMLLDSKTGAILAADTLPDGQESYMTPVSFSQPGDTTLFLVFGSGGETMEGKLYVSRLADLWAQNLSAAQVLASEKGHGFIAPPTIVDLNEDGYYDILAVSHAGKVIAWDMNKNILMWKKEFEGMESSNALAIGRFNPGPSPDVFAIMSKGVWPNYSEAYQIVLDGKNGEMIYMDSIGCGNLTSPVVYDMDHDGWDDVVMSTTEYDCAFRYVEDTLSPKNITHKLLVLSPWKKSYNIIDQSPDFKNLFSTPWLGDMDEDGYMDLVYAQCYNPEDLFKFRGMQVKRISTHIKMRHPSGWGGYMGSEGNAHYKEKK